MADRKNARAPAPAVPRLGVAAPTPSLRIDALRLRIPGKDGAAGHEFARQLSDKLAALGPSLLASGAGRSLELGTLRLSLPADQYGNAVGAISDAFERAILRAVRAAQRGSGGAG
jgi:hypothetical protein